ncbi:GNAT family N-acetyltransferase [Massilia sp. B-10]|nr:GNAT family N-acetyltransferase [Massilia sp. B-10]
MADGTYFAIEAQDRIVACGGWSKLATDFGGDQAKSGNDRPLDPATEPARIRAFFVDPDMARQGLGAMLLEHCTRAAARAGPASRRWNWCRPCRASRSICVMDSRH